MTARARSEQLFARSRKVIPAGVSSPVRAFTSVGGVPFFVDHGRGAYITDVDGNTYVDYVQSWGALLLGHAHPAVVQAVRVAAEKGTTFGAPTESEVVLAEEIVNGVEGIDKVRFVSSGTEATMTAIRLARAASGRDKIVKFAGCYHGHGDALLAASGSGVMTLGLPGSKGVPAAAVADTFVATYNTVPELDDDVACVIVEPVAANMGLVVPAAGFLEGLRAECDRVGAVLIFDEVITGFRLRKGSVSPLVNVSADLYCFGKVIGGGLPLAAVAGPQSLMDQLAPTGPVYQAGTLSGNPLATAAALATLRFVGDEDYGVLRARVEHLAHGLSQALQEAGIAAVVPRYETLLTVFFTDSEVLDYDGATAAAQGDTYARFFHAMADEGVSLAPSPYEVMFVSLAHGEEEIDRTIAAARRAAASLS